MNTKNSIVALLIFLTLIMISCSGRKQEENGPATGNKTADSGAAVAGKPAQGPTDQQNQGRESSVDMAQFTKTALDIPYAGTENKRQMLDIVYPGVSKPPYKVIVLFHGGAWMSGDKQSESLSPIFEATTQGYAVVSVNYRLSDEVKWPMPLYDAKAAIRFLRANGKKYELDTKNIVVWGLSAGGHIAEMLAATNGQPEFEDPSMGNKNASSSVQGVVSWYGVSDISSLTDAGSVPANLIMGFDVRREKYKAREASPIELVTKNFPPILLVHGTDDEFVPYRQSMDMMMKVSDVTGKSIAEMNTFKGAVHGDPMIKSPDNVINNLTFVDNILWGGKNPNRNTDYKEIKLSK